MYFGATKSLFTQVLTCILGLPLVFCSIDNVPRLDVTCDSTTMKIRLKFQRPFKGMVFANDSWNPACSFQVPLSTSVQQITLKIPYETCGTHIDHVQNGHSVISNTIKVQQQRKVRTINDTNTPVSCTILGLPESFSKLSSEIPYDDETNELNIVPSLELSIGQDFLGFNLSKELNLFNEPILVFKAKNASKYQDMDVKSCIIHENVDLVGNSLVHQLIWRSRCDDQPTDIISAFTLLNVTNPNELVALAKLQVLSQLSQVNNIYITCVAQLCRKMCKRECAKTAYNELFKADASHQISKRSLEEIEQSSIKQSSGLRSKLLKATVSVLNNRFFQRLREESHNRPFSKRSENHGKNTDQEPMETSEDFLKERASTGKEQRESRMVSETAKETSLTLSPKVQSKNVLKLSNNSKNGVKTKLSDRNRTLMKDLARKLSSRSQKLKEHNEKFKDLIKTAKEENFPLDGFFLKTPDTEIRNSAEIAENTEFDHDASEPERNHHKTKRSKLDNFAGTTSLDGVSELDSDEGLTTEEVLHLVKETSADSLSTNTEQDELKQSPDVLSIISVIEDITHRPTLVQTIPQELFPLTSMEPLLIQDKITETNSQEIFSPSSEEPRDSKDDVSETNTQEQFPVSSIEPHTEGEVSKAAQELSPTFTIEPLDTQTDFSEYVTKSPEIISTDRTSIEKLLKLQKSYDISHKTLIVSSIVMGLVIFILIATVIGLFFHIRKERRRHAIDNFLLYNFY